MLNCMGRMVGTSNLRQIALGYGACFNSRTAGLSSQNHECRYWRGCSADPVMLTTSIVNFAVPLTRFSMRTQISSASGGSLKRSSMQDLRALSTREELRRP